MAEEMSKKFHSNTTGASPKPKKRGIFSSTSKVGSFPATTQLMFPKDIQVQSPFSHALHFKTEDKIAILFKHKNYCVVQRKHDKTVAVLKNSVFKERNPPILFDGTNLDDSRFSNIQIVLKYSVAKTSYRDPEGIEFDKSDVIFTLAASHRKEFLGITESNKAGFFPSDLVLAITKSRNCFFNGMMLEVTAIENFEARSSKEFSVWKGENYDITKGKKGLFDWYASNDLRVPLNLVIEKGIDVPVMAEDEELYDTIRPEIKQPFTTEAQPLYEQHVHVLTSDQDNDYDTLRENTNENTLEPNQSTKGVGDSWKHQEDVDEIEKQFRERIALDSSDRASNGPPLPSPRKNSLYMDVCTSSNESPGYATTLVNFTDESISDEECEAAKIPTGAMKQERTLQERISDGCGTLRSVSETEYVTQLNPDSRIQDLLNKLAKYHDVIMSDHLRHIVAEYVDEDVWDQLGKRIKISKNKRREIENKEETIYGKTNELLCAWSEKFRSGATFGFLLDALVDVNPEDLDLILEDMFEELSKSS